jgi:CO/xanthine dehydrogenase FAD-binding subunit
MDVLTPRSLDEALRLKSEHMDALPIQGGTDVMVALNFDRARPEVVLNLNEVPSCEAGRARTGRSDSALRSRTRRPCLRSRRAARAGGGVAHGRIAADPQPRDHRRNLGTASPAGDALPPLVIEGARVELSSVRGPRRLPLSEFLVGVKRTALAHDELITGVLVQPSRQPQTFMKVGPRNAMVIAVCSLALVADRERGELRASFGSSAPTVRLVTAPLDQADGFPELVAEAASPIDDVRGTAAYRGTRVCSRNARSRGVSREVELTVTASATRPRCGRREPPTTLRDRWLCPARRMPASKASAARARCSSTGSSSAPASSSRPRRTGTTS